MTMAEMIFSENRLCNRNMLNINLHNSNSTQNFRKIQNCCVKKFRIGFLCTISSMNQKMIKF